MKKTHKDRTNLIDRLERKYARKLQMRNHRREQNFKNALRTMRGRRANDEIRTEAIEGIFYRGSRAAF